MNEREPPKCDVMSNAEIDSLRAMLKDRESSKLMRRYIKEKSKAVVFWFAIVGGLAGGVKWIIDMIKWSH